MIKSIFMLFFYSLMMMLIIFLMINNFSSPIILNILLIFYSILICMNLSLWKSNYIYSIILFLIMISGMLIIFLYFSSIISNEQLNLSLNYYYFFIMLIFLFLSFYLLKYTLILSPNLNEINLINFIHNSLFNNIIPLYSYPLNYFSMLSMFYLMFSIMIIIKMCMINSSPLRKIK